MAYLWLVRAAYETTLSRISTNSAGPVAADCPKAADWARSFYSEHYFFYAGAPDPILQLTTPEFGALLKKEWAYSKGEVGHFDYDPWLGAQDGEIGKPVRFSVETESPDMAIVSMSYPDLLDPKRPSERHTAHLVLHKREHDAGTFTISSLRSANRCHVCTQLRSPNRTRQPTGALGALRTELGR